MESRLRAVDLTEKLHQLKYKQLTRQMNLKQRIYLKMKMKTWKKSYNKENDYLQDSQ